MKTTIKTTFTVIVAAGILMGSVGSSYGAAVNWKSNNSDVWTNGARWSSDPNVPSSDDAASITRDVSVTLTNYTTTITGFTLGVNTTGMARLIINSGGKLITTSNDILIGYSTTNDNKGYGELTVKNGGVAQSNTGLITLSRSDRTNMSSTLNIGGEGNAEGAGWINASTISGSSKPGFTNTVNFNHNESRYTFVTKPDTGSPSPVALTGKLAANVKAVNLEEGKKSVTVFTADNTYTEGTTIQNHAVLLANTTDSGKSATGSGAVTLQSGGTLGGMGNIAGAVTVGGILRPGDYAYDAETSSYGVLSLGSSLTLQEGSTTLMGVAGDSRGSTYTALDIGGDLSVDGTLKIDLLSGFTIAVNETKDFQLFNVGGDILGNYEAYDFADAWSGLSLVWDDSALLTTGTLSVTAIPEPGYLIPALLFGLALFVAGKRRARQKDFSASLS